MGTCMCMRWKHAGVLISQMDDAAGDIHWMIGVGMGMNVEHMSGSDCTHLQAAGKSSKALPTTFPLPLS